MAEKNGTNEASIPKNLDLNGHISHLDQIIGSLTEARIDVRIPPQGEGEGGDLVDLLVRLREDLKRQAGQNKAVDRVKDRIQAGLTLNEVLDYCFESLREIIPYNRIGFALLEQEGKMVQAYWARSDASSQKIPYDYSAPLKGSSLQEIVETGKPRIISDLEAYLERRPDSKSTQLIVAEGMRSSFTCPLVVKGKPTGFLFFTSMKPHTYQDVHVEIFLEITQQISLALEKGRLYQRLSDMNEIKNRLLGIAAHDLRNPLGVVNGFAKMMKDGNFGAVNERQQKYLQKIIDSGKRMLTLIDNLLDVSAIESGKFELSLQEADILPLLEECQSYHQFLAENKGIDVIFEKPGSLPAIVMDPDRINQVLNNLLGNAIKYSHPNTTVTIKAHLQDDKICISVKDQGLGIPKDEIPSLFADYGRGSTRPTGGEKSSGLGLAIVKRILDAHDGGIKVESEPGQGSTFSFCLPINGPTKPKSSFLQD